MILYTLFPSLSDLSLKGVSKGDKKDGFQLLLWFVCFSRDWEAVPSTQDFSSGLREAVKRDCQDQSPEEPTKPSSTGDGSGGVDTSTLASQVEPPSVGRIAEVGSRLCGYRNEKAA